MGLASALSTALTGLAASESMVDVAGNNVANANTVGFKQSSAVFTTQFLQTMNLGTAPSGNARRHESRAGRVGHASGLDHARLQPGHDSNQLQPDRSGDPGGRVLHRAGIVGQYALHPQRPVHAQLGQSIGQHDRPDFARQRREQRLSDQQHHAPAADDSDRRHVGGPGHAERLSARRSESDRRGRHHAADHRLANAERRLDRDSAEFDVERHHGGRSGRRQRHHGHRQHHGRERRCRHVQL